MSIVRQSACLSFPVFGSRYFGRWTAISSTCHFFETCFAAVAPIPRNIESTKYRFKLHRGGGPSGPRRPFYAFTFPRRCILTSGSGGNHESGSRGQTLFR